MTMNLTITHKSGDDYAALIKRPGTPDTVLQPGESVDIGIHAGNSLHVFEIESEAAKEKRAPKEAQESAA